MLRMKQRPRIYEPGGREFESLRARQIAKGSLTGPFFYFSLFESLRACATRRFVTPAMVKSNTVGDDNARVHTTHESPYLSSSPFRVYLTDSGRSLGFSPYS